MLCLIPVKGKWLAIPSWYISYPLIINTGYFKEAGAEYTDKTSWQDLIKIGAKLKKAGHPFGIPVANTPDSNDDLLPWMWAFDALTFDKDGKVAFKRKEIAEWLRHAKEFYDKNPDKFKQGETIGIAYLDKTVQSTLQRQSAPSAMAAAATPPAPARKPQGLDPKGTDESYDEWQARVAAYERAQRSGGKAA